MPKPWELDWSAGAPASDIMPLPIVPFFGRQRPPMLGDGTAGMDVEGMPASLYQLDAAGLLAIPAAGASPVNPADAMPMQATGPTLAPPADPRAPAMALSFGADVDASAGQGPMPSPTPTAGWLDQPPQPSASGAPTAPSPSPHVAGAEGQHPAEPPVYDGWSGVRGGAAIQSGPSETGAIPAHLMLAPAPSGNHSPGNAPTASRQGTPQQVRTFVQAPAPQHAQQRSAAPVAPGGGAQTGATTRPRVRGAGRLTASDAFARARLGAPLRDRLIAGGRTVEDATALAANAAMESGANYRSRERIRGRPNQGGRGLWMWTGPRRELFRRIMGVSVENSTEDQQIHFNDWELAHTERRNWERAHAAGRGAPNIAAGFTTYVERPANPTRDSAERAAVAEAMGLIPVRVTGRGGMPAQESFPAPARRQPQLAPNSGPAARPPQAPALRPSRPAPDRRWVFEPVHGG